MCGTGCGIGKLHSGASAAFRPSKGCLRVHHHPPDGYPGCPGTSVQVVRPGIDFHHRWPGVHVRCLGCHVERRTDPAGSRGMGPGADHRGPVGHLEPGGHGTRRFPMGWLGRSLRTQESLLRHLADVLDLHSTRGPVTKLRLFCRLQVPGRGGTRWLHPRGLCPRRRVHPGQTARPGADRHGRLVAGGCRAVLLRFRCGHRHHR